MLQTCYPWFNVFSKELSLFPFTYYIQLVK